MANIALLVAFVGWGLWHVVSKLALRHISPPAFLFINSLLAFTLTPLYFKLNKGQPFTASGVGLAVAAFVCTGSATLAYSYAITTMNVSKAVLITGSYPALTCLLAVIFLGEPMTWSKFLGMLLVLGGVAVINK
jgi:bacterial/archaeal transporter family protein